MSDLDALLDQATPAQSNPPNLDALLTSATPQMQGAAREAALPASAFGKGLAQSEGTVGDLVNLWRNVAQPWITQKTGIPLSSNGPTPLDAMIPGASFLMPSTQGITNAVNSGARALGIGGGVIDRPDLQPQTEREKLEAGAAQGAGAALPYAVGGGAPALARGLLTGATGGAGATLGSQWKDHPLLGSALGAAGGSLLGGGVGAAGQRIANAATGDLGELGQAYQAAGIPLRMTGDVSENPFLRAIQAFAAKAPGGAGRTQAAGGTVVNAFGNAVENTASDLGGSRTLQQAGTALQNEGTNWLNNFRQQSAQKWGAVDALMPADTPVDITPYKTALTQVQKNLSGAPATAGVLQSPLSGRLLGALDADLGGGTTLPWSAVKGIRTQIGGMLESPQLLGDTNYGEIKKLYSSLTNTMKDALEPPYPVGGNLAPPGNAGGVGSAAAKSAFQDAANFTKNGHQFVDDYLTGVMNKDPEAAARSVLNSGGTGGSTLTALRAEMPKAADELASFKIRDMASSSPGTQNAAGNAISPTQYLTDWSRLSPEAKTSLFPNPDVKNKLDALAKVADSIKETAKSANTSNTTPAFLTYEMLNGLFERAPMGAGAGYVAGGLPGAAIGALGAAAGPLLPGAIASRIGANRLLAPLAAATPGGMLNPRTSLLGAPSIAPRLLGAVTPPTSLLNQQ